MVTSPTDTVELSMISLDVSIVTRIVSHLISCLALAIVAIPFYVDHVRVKRSEKLYGN